MMAALAAVATTEVVKETAALRAAAKVVRADSVGMRAAKAALAGLAGRSAAEEAAATRAAVAAGAAAGVVAVRMAAAAAAVQRVGRGKPVVGMAGCAAQVGQGAKGEDSAVGVAAGGEA